MQMGVLNEQPTIDWIPFLNSFPVNISDTVLIEQVVVPRDAEGGRRRSAKKEYVLTLTLGFSKPTFVLLENAIKDEYFMADAKALGILWIAKFSQPKDLQGVMDDTVIVG